MSKRTSNGWFVAEHAWNFVSVYAKEKTVCTLYVSEEDATEENQDELTAEMLANAKLIAAAPQMLDALEAVALFLHWLDQEQGIHLAGDMLHGNILEAIKAAKGG
jgi:hypothetical protein